MIQKIYITFLLVAATLTAENITWNGLGSNQDLNLASNWNPPLVPSSTENVVFNSVILNINTSPIENTEPFIVSSFIFPTYASVFQFQFMNQVLVLEGITGNRTNALFTLANANNIDSLGVQFVLNSASPISLGSAIFNVSNTANLSSGAFSSSALNLFVGSQMMATQSLQIGDKGSVTLVNSGVMQNITGGALTLLQGLAVLSAVARIT